MNRDGIGAAAGSKVTESEKMYRFGDTVVRVGLDWMHVMHCRVSPSPWLRLSRKKNCDGNIPGGQ